MVERYGVFTQRIARISRCIRRLKAEEMARFGLKGPHVSCLYYLGLDGPLYLTDRGREVFAALQARIASMEDAASMGLTEEQRSKMYAALELICGNLERLCAAEQEDTL